MTARIFARYVLATASLCPGLSGAETFGFQRAAFLAREMGARPTGMAGAFTAVADDASAVSWNPGGLGQLSSTQAIAMLDSAVEDMGVYYLALAVPAGAGVAGLSAVGVTYGSYEMRDLSGGLEGVESPADAAFGVSYAIPHGWLIGTPGWTGISVEVVQEAVGSGLVAGFGLGSLLPLRPGLSLGAAIQHIGPPKDGFSLPALAKAGVMIAASPSMDVCADLGYGLAAGEFWFSSGAELRVGRSLLLRGGYRHDMRDQGLGGVAGLALGAGVRMGCLGLDYAYLPRGDLGTSHKMSLVYSFPYRAPPLKLGEDTVQDIAEEDFRAGLRLAARGEYDLAMQKAKAAVQAIPGHWQSWQLLGSCRYQKGDIDGAIEAYRRALEINPDNETLVDFVSQLTAGRRGRLPPVAAAGGAAQAGVLYREAASLLESGDVDSAEARAREALRRFSGHWQSWQLIGNCQHARGETEEALQSYEKSLEINPDNPGLRAWVDRLRRP